MSIAQFFKHESRDIRQQKVGTAVRRLNTCVAHTHEIAAELRHSYREATESAKRLAECLRCRGYTQLTGDCGECEEDLS